MFLIHSIRLRDPWERCREGSGVVWRRAFHRPTGVEEGERIFLVASGLPDGARVLLNDVPLEPHAGQAGNFDVTSLVAEASRLEIQIADVDDSSALEKFPYDVRLGIVGE